MKIYIFSLSQRKKGSLTSGTLNQANLRLWKFVESVFCISWDLVLIPLCFSSVFHSNWIYFSLRLRLHRRVNEKKLSRNTEIALKTQRRSATVSWDFLLLFYCESNEKVYFNWYWRELPVSDGVHLQQAPPQVTECKVRKFQFHLKRHSSELKARHIQFPQRSLAINLSLPSVEIRIRKVHKLIPDSEYAAKHRHVLFRHWHRFPY